MKCKLCNSNNIKLVYEVPYSKKAAKIWLCKNCSLLWSEKNENYEDFNFDAKINWSETKYTKMLRFDDLVFDLEKNIDVSKLKTVLDIESCRGSFINWLSNKNKFKGQIFACDNDKNLDFTKIKNNPTVKKFYNKDINSFRLKRNYFDFIYCCHVLEHANDLIYIIKKITNSLKHNGLLYVDVPDINFIRDDNIIEEFFVDENNYFFNTVLLKKIFTSMGFEIIFHKKFSKYNISLLLKKSKRKINEIYVEHNNINIGYIENEINDYITHLKKNRDNLMQIGNKLNKLLDEKKVIIWGASRLLELLIQYGDLNLDKVEYLIDDYLVKSRRQVYNKKLNSPDEVPIEDIFYFVILARSSCSKIKHKINKYQPKIKTIITYKELL